MFRCPLSSTGSAQGAFPCFAGTTRNSDSLTTFPPGSVAFASAVPPPPVVCSQKEAGAHLLQARADHRMPTDHSSWSRQGLPGSWAALLCTCPALRPRRDPSAWPCFSSGVLPSATRTASALATDQIFEAQSRGPHTRCLRFAARVSPPPRKTCFRLEPSFAGRGLNPQGCSPKFQLLHRFLLGQASPGALPLSDLRVGYLNEQQPTLMTALFSDELENLP